MNKFCKDCMHNEVNVPKPKRELPEKMDTPSYRHGLPDCVDKINEIITFLESK